MTAQGDLRAGSLHAKLGKEFAEDVYATAIAILESIPILGDAVELFQIVTGVNLSSMDPNARLTAEERLTKAFFFGLGALPIGEALAAGGKFVSKTASRAVGAGGDLLRHGGRHLDDAAGSIPFLRRGARHDITTHSLSDNYIDSYVSGTLSREELKAVRTVSRGHPSLQRAGYRNGLQYIDTGTSVSKYSPQGHGVLLKAPEGAVPRGVLAEELQHAVDYSSGLHSAQRIRALKRQWGDSFNDVWHQGVFTRIAETLESRTDSIFHFFLSSADAPAFRSAAAGLLERIRARGVSI